MEMSYFLFILLMSIIPFVEPQENLARGFELPPQPTYFVLTPKVVRPGSVLQVSATVLRLLYEQLTLRISIKQEVSTDYEREEAYVTEVFTRKATRILQIKMPINSPPGKYFMHVEGSVFPNGGLLFHNRTEIDFDPKQLSMFIQTSKRVYHQNQVVRFRVIPVRPNLMPTYGTLSEISVVDPNNVTVRRWRNPMTNVGGIIDLSFALAGQTTEGVWQIRASHENFEQSQNFKVVEYWRPRFDVNVTMPPRLSEYGFGVYGLITANYTSGRPVKGNASIILELRDPRKSMQEKPLKTLQRAITVFEGKGDFLFTMDELKAGMPMGSQIGGNEVWVNVTVFDWFQLVQRQGYAYTFIFSSVTRIKFLGGFTRPFKPYMYFTAYIVLYQPDGSKVHFSEGRRVELDIYCNDAKPYISRPSLPITDDGTVQFTFRPNMGSDFQDCYNYRMVAKYRDQFKVIGDLAEQYIFKYISDSDTYLQITTSTKNPTVDKYMVFTVETNYYTPEINYQIAAGGNIVFADKLTMGQNSLSKTFSIAISRDMAPVARLLVYYIKLDGEVVTDALTFFANITRLNDVRVTFNRGKDLNVDTVEVNGFAYPGSFLSFNAIHYDLFVRGGVGTRSGFTTGTSILQDINLIDELQTYESYAQQPFNHTWYHDEEYIQRVYFPSPSLGPDANKTMNYSGLILFTDANYTKVSWWHDCNETINPARAFPCYSANDGKRCFSRLERCNGIKDCGSAVDELDCPIIEKSPQPRYPDDTFQQLSRHYDDGAWLWRSYFVKPDGRIDFRVDLPKIDTSWVVGAFAVDRETGFSVMSPPAKLNGVRRFFITLEAASSAVWGEQLGIRVAIFNYWDYWAEVLVEIKRSADYEIVQVGWGGLVSSYAPELVNNRTVQTLIYLEAGESKYVYVPVIPRNFGNTSITICAYTFVGSFCETHEVKIRMNGVEIRWHTPFILDLTTSSNLMTSDFRIRVPEQFVEPESREMRFVPGSPKAHVSVVGDAIGPALNDGLPFVTTESVVSRPDGAGENVLFEWSYNIQLLQYLRGTQQLTNDVRDRGLDYCNVVFQRALSYFNKDQGGFFNYRENPDDTSSWLTAIALQTFVEVAVSRWDQLIFVPDNFLEKMVQFLAQQQITDGSAFDGSFTTLNIYDGKYLPTYKPKDPTKVPTANEMEMMRRVPVTALVAISLKTQGLSVAQALAQSVAQKALAFLKRQLTGITDVFSLAITAYALSSSPGGDAQTAFNMLNATQRKDGFMYFSNAPMPDVVQLINKAGQPLRDPRDRLWNDAYGTQSTALALLTYYLFGKTQYANMIDSMTVWLTQQRNTDSGFSSTQDSIWALRALRRVAEDDFNRGIYSLKIKVEVTSQPHLPANIIIIKKENFSSVTDLSISPPSQVYGFIRMSSEGTGKALLQLTSSMNVDYPQFLKQPLNPIDKSVLSTWNVKCFPEFSGRNLTFMKMRACATWVAPDDMFGSRSNMAVLQIAMPSGYVVMNDELREMVRRGDLPNLRRAYWQYGRVDLYFDSVGREEVCATFTAMRWYPVANMTQTLMCRVFDYYEPGRFNYSLYQVFSLFSMTICHVCGSYECPYCPDFNVAHIGTSISFPLLLTTLLMIAAWQAFAHLSQSGGCADDVHRVDDDIDLQTLQHRLVCGNVASSPVDSISIM